MPECYREHLYEITHSNLCTEIMLPDGPAESFVCDLSSMNIAKYDEWRNTDAVEVLAYLLDAVMTEFIEKASTIPMMERAVAFARNHRALGIGWVGWHTYLQSKMVPFEGIEAKLLNAKIAREIRAAAYAASAKMAGDYGCAPVCEVYGRRNATLLAIAPTKSSAFILGQISEGIEPHRSNYQIKDLAKGKYTLKNPHLEALLRERGLDTEEVWQGILRKGGSVQHLEALTDRERAVFKTFSEISPLEVVQQAAQRQRWIDQGQSLNLMIHPSTPVKDVNALMIEAWRTGVKSLYYQHGVNAAQQFSRDILSCTSCEA
jgi:ribonucleoside-diphosphate reductase alpha chain